MKTSLIVSILFFLLPVTLEASKPIVMLENIDALEWKHVRIHDDAIDRLALTILNLSPLQIADWRDLLPPGLELKECVDYIMGLICVDFCHWDLDGKEIQQFYTKEGLRGSAAMSALAKEAYLKGVKIFEASFMKTASVKTLLPYFMGVDLEGNPMVIPWLEDRVRVMNQIGEILTENWSGSFLFLLQASNGKIFNQGKGFVELLVNHFPRFQDEYLYNGKKVGIYKLAQLSVMALQSILHSSLFCDCHTLTLCADYQLPRSLRALGVLEYGPELSDAVDQQRLIPFGSPMEIELRLATILSGERLKAKLNALLQKKGERLVTAQELDYFLWNYGRQLDPTISKHHLTRTIMY
jgi:hypothetical protein